MSVNANIKKARIRAKMTQEQAAEALNVSRQTISNWENGKTIPDAASMVCLSEVYHVSMDSLLRGVEEESVTDVVCPESEENPTVRIPETIIRKQKSKGMQWSVAQRGMAFLIVSLVLVLIYVLVPNLTNNRSKDEDVTELASAENDEYISISDSLWGDIILEASEDPRERYKYVEMSESILKTLSTEDLLRLAVINPSTKSSLFISSDITGAEGVARMVNSSKVYEVLMDREDVVETIYAVHDTLYDEVKDYLYETSVNVEMGSIEEFYKQTLSFYINYIEKNNTLTEEQEGMIQELHVILA